MKHKKIVMAGIGTEIGKTICSSIVCEALNADYWKPIQAGELDNSDSMKVKELISNEVSHVHESGYDLITPMSPHEAAKRDGVNIELHQLSIPATENTLVIEMAGGLLVPINDNDLFIDFVDQNQLPVILVSQYYLGSINHTLLSLEALKSRNVKLLGIIFNGQKVQSTFDIIMKHANTKCLLEVDSEDQISPEIIKHYAKEFDRDF